jgi:GNAT superfamily N-acetyltransferase
LIPRKGGPLPSERAAGVEICEAGKEHLPALVRLLAELFAQERGFSPDPEKQSRGLGLILDDPKLGQLFVARLNGEVIAMANLLITVSTAEGGFVALLEDMIVAKQHRGQGIGRQLPTMCCNGAGSKACCASRC